jgi:hypothetical protein
MTPWRASDRAIIFPAADAPAVVPSRLASKLSQRMNERLKRSRHLVLGAVLAGTCFASHADAFSFESTAPDFKVEIPNVPPFPLGEHPMHAVKPHLRYLGSQGAYTVSVMTPLAGAGITPSGCATSTFRQLDARPGAPKSEYVYRTRLNEQTYAAIYAAPHEGRVMLHAHFVSAAGTHCIEVHVSKVPTSKGDFAPWFKGFGAATIEPQ